MGKALAAVSFYLIVTFVLAAGTVRFAPRTSTSRQIRQNFCLFSIFPILLAFDVLRMLDASGHFMVAIVRRGFEMLSGRKLLDMEGRTYIYLRRSSAQHRRRKQRHREREAAETLENLSSGS